MSARPTYPGALQVLSGCAASCINTLRKGRKQAHDLAAAEMKAKAELCATCGADNRNPWKWLCSLLLGVPMGSAGQHRKKKKKWRILEPKWPPVSRCLSYVLKIVMDAVAIMWTFFGWYISRICGLENLITFFQIMCITFCFADFVLWWIVNAFCDLEFQYRYFEKSY